MFEWTLPDNSGEMEALRQLPPDQYWEGLSWYANHWFKELSKE